MAVTITLEYKSIKKLGYQTVEITFYNGGEGQPTSYNMDGNYMFLYDTNGTLLWRSDIVTFTSTDYVWGSTGWSDTVDLYVEPGQTLSIYAKTSDVNGLYSNCSDRSTTITLIGAYVSAQPLYSSESYITNEFTLRTPRGERLFITHGTGNIDMLEYGESTGTEYYYESNHIAMDVNSAKNIEYGLYMPNNDQLAINICTTRMATTYTDRDYPTFTVDVDTSPENNYLSAEIQISWIGTGTDKYPYGDGVSVSDYIIIYEYGSETNIIASTYSVDFRYDGSWSCSTTTKVKILTGCIVNGLWSNSCIDTTYEQTFFTAAANLIGDIDEIDRTGSTNSVIDSSYDDDDIVGYVKTNTGWYPIIYAYVKINNNYNLIKYFYSRGYYMYVCGYIQ